MTKKKAPVPTSERSIALDLARKHGIGVDVVEDILKEAGYGSE